MNYKSHSLCNSFFILEKLNLYLQVFETLETHELVIMNNLLWIFTRRSMMIKKYFSGFLVLNLFFRLYQKKTDKPGLFNT